MSALVFGGTGLIGKVLWGSNIGVYRTHSRSSGYDITESKRVREALLRAVNAFHDEGDDPLDVVINAAWPKKYHVRGFDNVMREAIDLWQLHGIKGCLISLASIYATLPPRFELYPDGMTKDADYVAAKAAIVQLTRYYARKVRGSGIRVNCISPGGVYRDEPKAFVDEYARQTNHGIMLPVNAVAQACKFLIECEHVTGQNIVVADGFDL